MKDCKYALCQSHRKRLAAFFSDPPQQGDDPLLQYRQIDKVVNMDLLEKEEPSLYQELTKDELPFARQGIWYWSKGQLGGHYTDRKKAMRIKRYVEEKPSSKVLLRRMPKELSREWTNKVGEDNLISAWWELAYDKQQEICKPCPVRPLDEDNCYLRFSNYPGMNSFRQGFMLTVLYASTIDDDRLKDALLSFPHLDRAKRELPKDKVGQLIEMCEGTPVNKGAEGMFNALMDMLDKVKPEGTESTAEKIRMEEIPFVDEFISKYIYREQPYSLNETRELIPYVETLQEVAEWAVWGTDSKPVRTRIIGFKSRMDSFTTALRLADKYALEISMSY